MGVKELDDQRNYTYQIETRADDGKEPEYDIPSALSAEIVNHMKPNLLMSGL